MSKSVDVHTIVSVPKHTTALLDYEIDWTTWLGGDTISASAWVIPDGLTNGDKADTFTAKTTTVWLDSGVDGQTYSVVNNITTALGRKESKEIQVKVSIQGGA
jgi:hypothetical protein